MKKSTPQNGTSKSDAQGVVRINLSIAKALLEQVDKAAAQDYTTRSDVIRAALLWYLRPQGRAGDQTDPDTILKTLQQRHAQTELRKILKR